MCCDSMELSLLNHLTEVHIECMVGFVTKQLKENVIEQCRFERITNYFLDWLRLGCKIGDHADRDIDVVMHFLAYYLHLILQVLKMLQNFG